MDKATIDFIDKLTERIIEIYNIQIPIIDMEEIVNNMGGTVIEVGDLCDEGAIKHEDDSFELRIDIGFDSSNYDIAVMLGHLILHMGYLINDDVWKRQPLNVLRGFATTEAEYQAVYFGYSLMMPKEMYLKTIDKYADNNQVDISKVAKEFLVRDIDASSRGKLMGNLKW